MAATEGIVINRKLNTQSKTKLFLAEQEIDESDEEPDQEVSRTVRLRRTMSVSSAEAITHEDTKKRRHQPDRPIHKPRDSLLSWSSGFNNYEGIINWGFLILIIGGLRLLLENIIRYGILVNPVDWVLWLVTESKKDNYYRTPLWLLGSNLHFLFAFQVEKFLAQKRLPSWTGFYLHAGQLAVIVLGPIFVFNIWPEFYSLLGRMVICTFHTVMFLKLWSYVQVNHWCRVDRDSQKKNFRGRSHSFRNFSEERMTAVPDVDDSPLPRASSSEKIVNYPDNLTLSDLYYFLMAPTLCYELNFPRTSRIRMWFLVRRAAEVLVLSNLLVGLFQQWMIPSIRNSFKPFSEMDFFRTWERLLKLSIPNHLLWLTWFYVVFHSFLNTMSELMRFADRNFYDDWWNAKDVGTFWKLWNLPVHKWAVRHMFLPILRAGYSKFSASIMVFFISAFFHEYLVSVPLQMYKIFVFLGMAMQIPLIHISSVVAQRFGPRCGNVIVWASLILGQPLGILVYFHDYAVRHIDPASLVT